MNIVVDYGNTADEPADDQTAPAGALDVIRIVDLIDTDGPAFFQRLAGGLFGDEPEQRIGALAVVLAVAPLMEPMVPALTAALLEEPGELDLDRLESGDITGAATLTLFGVTTRRLACRCLATLQHRSAAALPRLYELLDRAARESAGGHGESAGIGISAVELASTIAQIEGSSAAPRLLPIFDAVLKTVAATNRDDSSIHAAVRGLGYLDSAGAPLMHWLNWMDRERDAEMRFLVACAGTRVRQGEFDDGSYFRFRAVSDVVRYLTGGDTEVTMLAEAAQAVGVLASTSWISPEDRRMLIAELTRLTDHYLPTVVAAARESLSRIAS